MTTMTTTTTTTTATTTTTTATTTTTTTEAETTPMNTTLPPTLCRMQPYGVQLTDAASWTGHVCCCDSTFKGDELKINLTITGQQIWENSLKEIRSPKAKRFHSRTEKEIEILYENALGDSMTDFRYYKHFDLDTD